LWKNYQRVWFGYYFVFNSEEKYWKVGVWTSMLVWVVVLAVGFLLQYFYRNLSGSGFLFDTRGLGVYLAVAGDGREVVLFSVAFLHNIYAICVNPK
jgi:transposase